VDPEHAGYRGVDDIAVQSTCGERQRRGQRERRRRVGRALDADLWMCSSRIASLLLSLSTSTVNDAALTLTTCRTEQMSPYR